jgi:hypothetical protein
VKNGSEAGRKSDAGLQGDEDPTADADEASRSYCIGPLTITVSRIREMGDLRYFAEGDARAPGEETVPESADDEAVVFEEFFAAGLRMPPHSALTEILWKFRVQLHQLTPNAIVQLSRASDASALRPRGNPVEISGSASSTDTQCHSATI